QVCAPAGGQGADEARPPGGPGDRAPAEDLIPWYVDRLTLQPLPSLDRWTARLLRRLSADPRYGLAPGQVPPDAGEQPWLPLPDRWEGLARALTEYLANSGVYTYTLDLRRQDPDADPVLDFLENVKEGSCERYAAALA